MWVIGFCFWLTATLTGEQARAAPFIGMWAHATQAQSRSDAEALLQKTHAAGVDALYVLVWYGGQAWYRTDHPLIPMATGVEAGFDPLGYLVEGAHKRGMELHAWFVNGNVYAADGGPVLKQHPDWAMVDGAGNPVNWYDLGQPEVRRFQADLMIDVLTRYRVDGVHFDYIRHSGRTTCWCDRCQARFRERTGLNPADFRPDALPCRISAWSNPLAKPTTAKVLAWFSNGVPAIYLNELGRGQVFGLNYRAQGLGDGLAREAVRRFLTGKEGTAEAAAEKKPAGQEILVIYPVETKRQYGRDAPAAFVRAMSRLGRRARIVAHPTAADFSAAGAAALVCAYRVPEALAEELVKWVEGGGRLVVVDGPVFSMNLPSMQKLTGMGATAPYFSATLMVERGEPSELVPTREIDPEQYERFLKEWDKFQMEGPTALVREVYHRVKALRPEAKVTAAVWRNRLAAAGVYQDWYAWLREGIMDYVIPMCYVMDSKSLEADLDEWQEFDPKLQRILPGLAIYQRQDGKTVPRPPELVTDQITRCLKRGARGVCLFVAGIMDEPIAAALRRIKAGGIAP